MLMEQKVKDIIKNPSMKDILEETYQQAINDKSNYKAIVTALKEYSYFKDAAKERIKNKLNVDIHLAAIVVFVGRMFTNLAIIRRHYVEILTSKLEKKTEVETKE